MVTVWLARLTVFTSLLSQDETWNAYIWKKLQLGKGCHVAVVKAKRAPHIDRLYSPILNTSKKAVCCIPTALHCLGCVHQHLHAVLAVTPCVLHSRQQQQVSSVKTEVGPCTALAVSTTAAVDECTHFEMESIDRQGHATKISAVKLKKKHSVNVWYSKCGCQA